MSSPDSKQLRSAARMAWDGSCRQVRRCEHLAFPQAEEGQLQSPGATWLQSSDDSRCQQPDCGPGTPRSQSVLPLGHGTESHGP